MNKKKYFTSFMFSFCWKYRGKKNLNNSQYCWF